MNQSEYYLTQEMNENCTKPKVTNFYLQRDGYITWYSCCIPSVPKNKPYRTGTVAMNF